ncbi:hypothetical protein BC830DRAFT_121999 [Chytriomyces sp. MP71]|nr:hypothetical protein BC830DRAFT_121999 [Chytriomyces sp. MP71]
MRTILAILCTVALLALGQPHGSAPAAHCTNAPTWVSHRGAGTAGQPRRVRRLPRLDGQGDQEDQEHSALVRRARLRRRLSREREQQLLCDGRARGGCRWRHQQGKACHSRVCCGRLLCARHERL